MIKTDTGNPTVVGVIGTVIGLSRIRVSLLLARKKFSFLIYIVLNIH